MENSTHDRILNLICGFLGDYGKGSGEWYSFNCPSCAAEKMVDADGKYNLELTINPDERGGGGFHCWRCGEYSDMKGTLNKLFRRYADSDTNDEYRRLLRDYRESRAYELGDIGLDEPMTEVMDVMLPQGFKSFAAMDTDGESAMRYLRGRGVTDKIIKRFGIGYIAQGGVKCNECGRIYFPSYDLFGTLNYWVGRDYTGKKKQKMMNANTPKQNIIFNEHMVNWYEPITLVEGPFDHVVTPNSIPLLGKTLDKDSLLYESLVKRSRSKVRIFLDDDAWSDAVRIYKMLNETVLRGRLEVVKGEAGHDPSDIYRDKGADGILDVLCSAYELTDFDLAFL